MNNSLEGFRNPNARAALKRYHRNKKLGLNKRLNRYIDPVYEYNRSERMANGDVRMGKWADWGQTSYRHNGILKPSYRI